MTKYEARRSSGRRSCVRPCQSDEEIVGDAHVAARSMLVECPAPTASLSRSWVPGNPVKISGVAEGPETRVPWHGEHTDDVLAGELGIDRAELDGLRSAGVIS